MPESRKGPLVIIGGHEDKEGERVILREVANALNGNKLVIATLASREPEEYFESYREAFKTLGVEELVELYVEDRAEADDPSKLALLDGAGGVFFTGGDQMRITRHIGGSPVENAIKEVRERGGVIAGTSAGASVMGDTMLSGGGSKESPRLGDLGVASGLGLLHDVIIDQHFAERGRIGRLLGVVAGSDKPLGVGIDEDTAIVVNGSSFRVIGSGGAYVIDGTSVSASNITAGKQDDLLSVTEARIHLLAPGDTFDLASRQPVRSS
jgi:cyanophycinase